MPGAFKLDHLHPVRPILFSKLYNFFTFILEANSYYPRGLIMRKGNSPNFRNELDGGVCVPGEFKLDHLHPVKQILFFKFYNYFTFILEVNSYYPRAVIQRSGLYLVLQDQELLPDQRWIFCRISKLLLAQKLLLVQKLLVKPEHNETIVGV